ncbi:ORF6N domain-containing protein [Clostridium sp. NSJ-49]|uniref:ORF6N domain-containing protein n=1 Tax=Clostridium TaxID=1485 RepID=UPI00164CD76B|nr:ORF6N domain-containing protein [Clostridium sp. NSJ-49]MBC5624739.1 ORF6N domain-containing protein [Clostridium sp. NSJ-49]
MENLKHGSRKPNVKVNGLVNIEGMKFHDIEGGFGEGKKAMLVKEIANIHGREVKKVNELINNNRKRFKDDVDIIDLKTGLSKGLVLEMGFTNAQYGNANNIYLLSERGYSKLLKILEDDFAWEQYEKLVDGYFNMRGQALNTSELSQELQMFNKMFQALANNELEQKRLKAEIEETKEEIQGIRDVVTLDTNGWRKETANIINKIAYKLGGFEHIKPIREESYKLLNETIGVDINRRLKNKQKNMALEGVSKSKINKVNVLDIIGEDKKLLNGYISIISKMAIKYGVA